MGRGRAKAKQTKVARELKYNSGGFDPDALRAELVSSEGQRVPSNHATDPDETVEDDTDPD